MRIGVTSLTFWGNVMSS